MPRTLTYSIARSGVALVALVFAGPILAQTVSDPAGVPANSPGFNQLPPAPSPAQDRNARSDRRSRDDDRSSRDDRGERGERGERGQRRHRIDVTPYIEVNQTVAAELSRGGDTVTYTSVAAGVQGVMSTRRVEVAADVRYDHNFNWGGNRVDSDVISGAVRGRMDLTQGFGLEGGALATRTGMDGQNGLFGSVFDNGRNTADLYSAYISPTFSRRLGDVDVGAAYRFGYSRAEINGIRALDGSRPMGMFDDSTNHALIGSVGMRPGRLPFGWQLSGSWERDSSGQLDQRYSGRYGRLDVTVPVSPTLAVVGGVGYEDISVSNRAPLRDADGNLVVGSNGQYVADHSKPREIAFETDGLMYDAGLQWRPSPRFMAEGRVGHRYGDFTFTGSVSYQPSRDTVYQLGIYDTVSTVGRSLTSGLVGLPTDFTMYRDGVGGGLSSCAFGSNGGNCLTPITNNLTGFAFRSRGGVFSMSSRQRLWTLGLALGYDRRNYLARGLADVPGIDGAVDETWFANIVASRPLSERTSMALSAYANYYDGALSTDALMLGASGYLSHLFAPRLTGNAGVSINSVDQDGFNNRVFTAATLGMRYSF